MEGDKIKAVEIIDKIIESHEKNIDKPILLSQNTYLVPKIDYSGKMAKEAYKFRRRFPHKNRRYAGILDFQIYTNNIKMQHEELIPNVALNIPREHTYFLYNGESPNDLQVDSHQLDILLALQCAFIEQEINWGVNNFQLSTYFGNPNAKDSLLKDSAPRDYLMVYIEKCYHLREKKDYDEDKLFDSIIKPNLKKTKSKRNIAIMPPIDLFGSKMVFDCYREFMPSYINKKKTKKWIDNYLDRIDKLCNVKNPNPLWTELFKR